MIKKLLRKIGGIREKEATKKEADVQETKKEKEIKSSLKTTQGGKCPNNFCSFVFNVGDTEALDIHCKEEHPLDMEERVRLAGL